MPWPAKYSASASVETVMPPGCPAVARRATSIDLAVFMCGRSGTPWRVEALHHGIDVTLQDVAIQHQARGREVGRVSPAATPPTDRSAGPGRGMCFQGKRERTGLVRPGASTSTTCSCRKNSSKPPRKCPRDFTTTTRAAAMSRPKASKKTGSAHCIRFEITTTVMPSNCKAAHGPSPSVLLA